MQYMLDDRLAFFDFLEREELIAPNTDSQMAGPRMYGYVSDLPDPDTRNAVTLKNLWGWAESQEAANISPEMYNEFVLPYLAKLSERFGLVYYGCCERVDDRLPAIIEAIPNLRSVSISGWTNFSRAAELLGTRYVYSRKPTPAHISGAPTPLGPVGKGHARYLRGRARLQSRNPLSRHLHDRRRPLATPPLGRHDQGHVADVGREFGLGA